MVFSSDGHGMDILFCEATSGLRLDIHYWLFRESCHALFGLQTCSDSHVLDAHECQGKREVPVTAGLCPS